MRGPHPGGQTFAANVAEREDDAVIRLFNRKEISRQMTDGEDLAGDFKILVMQLARRAKTPMDLRSFEDCGVQLGVVFLQRG